MELKTVWRGEGWYELGVDRPKGERVSERFDGEEAMRARLAELYGERSHAVFQGDGAEPAEDWAALYGNVSYRDWPSVFEQTRIGRDYGAIPFASGDDLAHDLAILEGSEEGEAARFADALRIEIRHREARAKLYMQESPDLFDADSEWVSVSTAASMLGVNRQRVHSLIKSGQLDARKVGNFWNVHRSSVEARKESAPKAGRPRKS